MKGLEVIEKDGHEVEKSLSSGIEQYFTSKNIRNVFERTLETLKDLLLNPCPDMKYSMSILWSLKLA